MLTSIAVDTPSSKNIISTMNKNNIDFLSTATIGSFCVIFFSVLNFFLMIQTDTTPDTPCNGYHFILLAFIIMSLVGMIVFLIKPVIFTFNKLFIDDDIEDGKNGRKYKIIGSKIILSLLFAVVFYTIISIVVLPLLTVSNLSFALLLLLCNFIYDIVCLLTYEKSKDDKKSEFSKLINFMKNPYVFTIVTILSIIVIFLCTFTPMALIELIVFKAIVARFLFYNKKDKEYQFRNNILLTLLIVIMYIAITYALLDAQIKDTVKIDNNSLLSHLYNVLFINILKAIGGTVAKIAC
ncbi:hypothetical protein SLOPH_1175 [Spraguea lophii 42_110]|uniref:Uncharacterized protein n=1 Tax=Spraguea lophii (strain 42_110) TaxID=1358809 RepID=S7W6I7_SPRLO|nr:hypothetical protein SLOPH_1175 [Spraguea lophii 42_110]